MWDNVRSHAEHLPWRSASPPVSRWGQFVQGFCLPFQLVRVLLADPDTRRRFLTVGCAQAAVVVVLVVAAWDWKEVVARKVGEHTGLDEWKAYGAALFSSLHLFQWIVIALSRDHHTVLEREASLRTGLEPEDGPLEPRVRLNVGWLVKKLKQRWRAVWLFAWGVPVLWVLSRLTQVFKGVMPSATDVLAALLSLWGAWWFVVFTAGKSSRGWDEPAPRAPWFLRAWSHLGSRVALLGRYGARWERASQSVFSPAAEVERRPWGFLGLGLARALSALPLIRCFLRPTIPVAAAHLLAPAGALAEGRAIPPASAREGMAALPPDAAPGSPVPGDTGARRTG